MNNIANQTALAPRTGIAQVSIEPETRAEPLQIQSDPHNSTQTGLLSGIVQAVSSEYSRLRPDYDNMPMEQLISACKDKIFEDSVFFDDLESCDAALNTFPKNNADYNKKAFFEAISSRLDAFNARKAHDIDFCNSFNTITSQYIDWNKFCYSELRMFCASTTTGENNGIRSYETRILAHYYTIKTGTIMNGDRIRKAIANKIYSNDYKDRHALLSQCREHDENLSHLGPNLYSRIKTFFYPDLLSEVKDTMDTTITQHLKDLSPKLKFVGHETTDTANLFYKLDNNLFKSVQNWLKNYNPNAGSLTQIGGATSFELKGQRGFRHSTAAQGYIEQRHAHNVIITENTKRFDEINETRTVGGAAYTFNCMRNKSNPQEIHCDLSLLNIDITVKRTRNKIQAFLTHQSQPRRQTLKIRTEQGIKQLGQLFASDDFPSNCDTSPNYDYDPDSMITEAAFPFKPVFFTEPSNLIKKINIRWAKNRPLHTYDLNFIPSNDTLPKSGDHSIFIQNAQNNGFVVRIFNEAGIYKDYSVTKPESVKKISDKREQSSDEQASNVNGSFIFGILD